MGGFYDPGWWGTESVVNMVPPNYVEQAWGLNPTNDGGGYPNYVEDWNYQDPYQPAYDPGWWGAPTPEPSNYVEDWNNPLNYDPGGIPITPEAEQFLASQIENMPLQDLKLPPNIEQILLDAQKSGDSSKFWNTLGKIFNPGEPGSKAGTIAGMGSTLGNLFSGWQQSNAAKNAAQAQVEATKYATDIEYKAKKEALDLQERMFNKGQENIQPWLDSGKLGLSAINRGLGLGEDAGSGAVGFGEFLQNYDKEFVRPTLDETSDPGLAFRIAEGRKSIENSAAAQQGSLSGKALKDAIRFSQDYGSSEYDKIYGRSRQEYLDAYNMFEQNQNKRYNRLAGVSGTGQTSANQLAGLGQNYGANAGNVIVNAGDRAADLATQAGNARASGFMGSGNAWGGAVSSIGNNLLQAYLLSQMNKG